MPVCSKTCASLSCPSHGAIPKTLASGDEIDDLNIYQLRAKHRKLMAQYDKEKKDFNQTIQGRDKRYWNERGEHDTTKLQLANLSAQCAESDKNYREALDRAIRATSEAREACARQASEFERTVGRTGESEDRLRERIKVLEETVKELRGKNQELSLLRDVSVASSAVSNAQYNEQVERSGREAAEKRLADATKQLAEARTQLESASRASEKARADLSEELKRKEAIMRRSAALELEVGEARYSAHLASEENKQMKDYHLGLERQRDEASLKAQASEEEKKLALQERDTARKGRDLFEKSNSEWRRRAVAAEENRKNLERDLAESQEARRQFEIATQGRFEYEQRQADALRATITQLEVRITDCQKRLAGKPKEEPFPSVAEPKGEAQKWKRKYDVLLEQRKALEDQWVRANANVEKLQAELRHIGEQRSWFARITAMLESCRKILKRCFTKASPDCRELSTLAERAEALANELRTTQEAPFSSQLDALVKDLKAVMDASCRTS